MSGRAAITAKGKRVRGARHKNPWAALVVLCLGSFMILLDTTIVNNALPSMVPSLGASVDQMLWVLDAYLLVFAALLIPAGRLGDVMGQRNLFVVGPALFTVASAACGLAQDPGQIIAARVAQGMGAAMLSPQTLALISIIFPPQSRGAALGIAMGMIGLAAVSGPTLGGLIVTHLSWRWVFYVNVPVGVVAILLSFLFVPEPRASKAHGLDPFGIVLATVALFAIVFGLIEGQRYGWGEIFSFITIPEVIGAGVILLAGFLAWEIFYPEPLVPLSLFSNRSFSVTISLGALTWFALYGFLFILIIYLQVVLGMSALRSGLTALPMTLALTLIAPFSGLLAGRFGARYILSSGLALFAAGIGAVATVASRDSGSLTFTLPLLVAGLGMGATFAPLTTEAMQEVPPALAGAASGILNSTRQLGSAIGAAVIGAVLQNRLTAELHERAVAASTRLPAQLRQGFVDGFSGAARRGLEVGRGQSGGVHLPQSLPPQTTHLLQCLIHDVFESAFVGAMRPALAVAAVALILGAPTGLLIARQAPQDALPEERHPDSGEGERRHLLAPEGAPHPSGEEAP